ncbi:MAG: hypothetical protein R2795_14340 [Saprospiraceae bacterium]
MQGFAYVYSLFCQRNVSLQVYSPLLGDFSIIFPALMHTLASLTALFEQYLSQHSIQHEPQGLYAPVNYIMQLGETDAPYYGIASLSIV